MSRGSGCSGMRIERLGWTRVRHLVVAKSTCIPRILVGPLSYGFIHNRFIGIIIMRSHFRAFTKTILYIDICLSY
jgi:hypothetical protein